MAALDTLVRRLREHDPLAALIAFGSYARREFGGSSDLDLLIVLDEVRRPNGDSGRAAGTAVAESHAGAGEEFRAVRSTIVRLISELEAEWRLPMHLAPLVASLDRVDELGADLVHNIWADGVVLFARAGALARLQPPGLAPWTLVRFTAARGNAVDRVRLSRRLHGIRTSGAPGILRDPAVVLGPGALLIPADWEQAVRAALDEAGATYDFFPIWREP